MTQGLWDWWGRGCNTGRGGIAGSLDGVDTVYAHTHERVRPCVNACPDYAGIIAGRWRKLSLKVRVVWLISSSLYHFN